MKKLIAIILTLLTIILSFTSCTTTVVITGDPEDYIESKIKNSAYGMDYVSVSANGTRKVDVSVTFKILGNDICFFGENAKKIYEAATSAASESGKKIGDFSIRMDYNNGQDYIWWTQIVGSFGDLSHSRSEYTPGDFVTIHKAAKYFNYSNKDKFTDILNETTAPPTTEPPTTEDPDAEQKAADVEYIEKQLKSLSLPNKLSVDPYVSISDKGVYIYHSVSVTEYCKEPLIFTTEIYNLIDKIHECLTETNRSINSFSISYWGNASFIPYHIVWVSSDLINGRLTIYHDSRKQNVTEKDCSINELIETIIENTQISEETTTSNN